MFAFTNEKWIKEEWIVLVWISCTSNKSYLPFPLKQWQHVLKMFWKLTQRDHFGLPLRCNYPHLMLFYERYEVCELLKNALNMHSIDSVSYSIWNVKIIIIIIHFFAITASFSNGFFFLLARFISAVKVHSFRRWPALTIAMTNLHQARWKEEFHPLQQQKKGTDYYAFVLFPMKIMHYHYLKSTH